ncbi:FixH family protein [Sphingobacterium sp. Mn56C]|uniref:FixH family protein n=1 Tax=Sphingobacterium sp. Mn56C TaxID=3395261 RepID=UPI003BE04AE3
MKINVVPQLLAAALLMLAAACGTPTSPTSSTSSAGHTTAEAMDFADYTKIQDTVFQDKNISLWAKDSLTSKFESIFIRLTDKEGNPAALTSLNYDVKMDMGMMAHGAPFYPLKSLGNGIYQADIVFIMPNIRDMGKGWLLQLANSGLKDSNDTLSIALPVKEASVDRTLATNTQADGRVFVSCLLPDQASVGEQPIHFVLHKIEKDAFPIVDGYSIEVEPFMPDMGHGSDKNIAAKSTGDGHYEGRVNFSMKGHWDIKVRLLKDGKPASEELLTFPVQVK